MTLPLLNPWVRGDGVGYYAFARALLIQHNLDFAPDYQHANEGFREARLDANGDPKRRFEPLPATSTITSPSGRQCCGLLSCWARMRQF